MPFSQAVRGQKHFRTQVFKIIKLQLPILFQWVCWTPPPPAAFCLHELLGERPRGRFPCALGVQPVMCAGSTVDLCHMCIGIHEFNYMACGEEEVEKQQFASCWWFHLPFHSVYVPEQAWSQRYESAVPCWSWFLFASYCVILVFKETLLFWELRGFQG